MQVIPMIRLLILSLLLSLTPGASFASATSCPTLQRGVSSWSNPLTPTVRRAARPTQTPSATITCGSFWQLVQVLGAQGTARTPAFVADLVYDFSFNQVESIVSAAMDSALAQDDYLRFTFSGYQVRYRGTDGHVAIEFDFRYLTDATQEAFVNQRVAALDAQLTEAGMTDEEREIAAHDWVVKNVEYDRAEVSGDVRYTAYGALSNGVAVCQGYALLVYRLLDAAGLEARIVPAEVDHGRKHAWNMVRVCGTWYHPTRLRPRAVRLLQSLGHAAASRPLLE